MISGFTLKRYPGVKHHINEAPGYGQAKYRSHQVVNRPWEAQTRQWTSRLSGRQWSASAPARMW